MSEFLNIPLIWAGEVGLVLIVLGALALRKSSTLRVVLTSSHIGGRIARKILPIAITLPMVFGWFRVLAQQNGYVNLEVGSTLLVFSLTVFMVGLLVYTIVEIEKLSRKNQNELNERELSQYAAAESEARLRFALSSARMGTWTLDLRDQRLTIDEDTKSLLGITRREDGVEQVIDDIVHPDDRETQKRVLENAIANQSIYRTEVRVLRSDGTLRWILSTGRARYSPGGEPLQLVGLVMDITERKLIEERLKTREAELRSYAEAMPQMAFIANREGEITYYNERHYQYFGVQSGAHDGWRWRDSGAVIHPDDLHRTVELWTHALRTGSIYEIEYRLRRHDGAYRWHLGRAVPARDGSGAIVNWYGTNTDIHDRQELLEHSKASEERLTLATTAAGIGIWEWDISSGAIKVTEIQKRIFGLIETDELTIDDLFARILPEDGAPARTALHEAVREKHDFSAEFRIRRADQTAWIISRGRAIYDAHGSALRMFGVSIDITERKNTEIKIQHALESRDEFLSIASHELKTPLTSLKLHTQLHQRLIRNKDPRAFETERIEGVIQQTEKQVTRLTRLVDDMLDVSRIRTGRLTLQLEHFNLCTLADDVLERMRHQFTNAGYSFPELTCEGPAEGDWDRLRVEQVITNLLTNAIRYGRGNPIEVGIHATDQSVRLHVKDQGIGISESASKRIFDRFERAVDASDVSGLGLGLFIASKIVSAHGGHVWLESTLDQGSTFFVELPKNQTGTLRKAQVDPWRLKYGDAR